MDAIGVLVVDDGVGLTQDLLLAFRRRGRARILGPAADELEAITALIVERVELVVVNLDRADDRGVAVVAAIRNSSDVRVMAATRLPASPLIELSLAAGACGILPIERDHAHLSAAFVRARAGELVLPADEVPTIVERIRHARAGRADHALVHTLTVRERQILAALAEGATTTSIAIELGISPATVQSHVKNVLGKLGVHSKVEAFGAAWRAGLVATSRTA
jgi:DNA-binding NarL/FixJ family response regulator